MKKTDSLTLLEELCEKLSITVKYDRFFGRGGYCKLRERPFFIINDSLSNDAKEQIFVNELRSLDFSNIYIPPKLRELFDR
ncbi:MAG TPA: hypothetical protein VF399_01625 [bacterium]